MFELRTPDGEPKSPVESPLQQYPGHHLFHGFPRSREVLSLLSEYRWRHHDLCQLQRLTALGISGYAHASGLDGPEIEEALNATTDWDDFRAARLREAARVVYLEIESASALADQMFVVGLWSLVERYSVGVLKLLQSSALTGDEERLFLWRQCCRTLVQCGLDVKILPEFQRMETLRLLNNAIKHSGVIDHRLAKRLNVSLQSPQPIESVTITVQDYSDTTYSFINRVIELGDNLLRASSTS